MGGEGGEARLELRRDLVMGADHGVDEPRIELPERQQRLDLLPLLRSPP